MSEPVDDTEATPKPEQPGRESFIHALEAASTEKPYLGDWQTVNGLLRNFAQRVLTHDHAHPDEFAQTVDHASRELAKTFLGFNKAYAGPKWNTPGNIDTYLAHRLGVDSHDPEERVAGALLQLLQDLYELANTAQQQKLIGEQWAGEAGDIMRRYCNLFLGIRETDQYADPSYHLTPSNLTRR